MTAPASAFGGPGYGVDPYGPHAGFVLQGAIATAENVVRLYFSAAPYFSGLRDPPDGSSAALYAVAPLAGGPRGLDGAPAQAVGVLFAQLGEDPDTIDVFLDRPLSPAPCEYVVSATVADALTKTPVAVEATFLAVFREVVAAQPDALFPSRDVANPQTAADQSTSSALLGTFVVDDSGDYAVDEGLVSYKKRIIRRLITRKNGFAHLPGYGVGVPQYGKRLARASVRGALAADAESQIAQEPETDAVSVDVRPSPTNPGVFYVVVSARTKSGGAVKFAAPFSVG